MGRVKEDLQKTRVSTPQVSFSVVSRFIEIYRVINFLSMLSTVNPLIMHLLEKKKFVSTQGTLLQCHKKPKYFKIWFLSILKNDKNQNFNKCIMNRGGG